MLAVASHVHEAPVEVVAVLHDVGADRGDADASSEEDHGAVPRCPRRREVLELDLVERQMDATP